MQQRQLRPDDHDFIVSVVDEWWGGRTVHPLLPRLFAEHFNSTSSVIVDNEVIIAFLIGFRSQSHLDTGYIHFVGVHPAYRQQSLGRQLYTHFFDQMRSLGCTQVQCITSPSNKVSIGFHFKMGFEIVNGNMINDDVSVSRNHAGEGQHRVIFTKSIESHDHN